MRSVLDQITLLERDLDQIAAAAETEIRSQSDRRGPSGRLVLGELREAGDAAEAIGTGRRSGS